MGTIYAENNHTDKAMEFYNKAIKIKPNPGPLIKIGALYANKGMLAEAKETFENVVHLYPQDPRSAEAYVSLGLMSLNEKKTQIAEYYFQQAYRLKTQDMK